MSQSANLIDRFAQSVPEPSRRFLTDGHGAEFTYGGLFEQAGRFGAALAGLGVVPGDRVAVQTAKTVPSLFLYLGCLRIGAVYLPLNTAYTPAEIAYALNDAEPRLRGVPHLLHRVDRPDVANAAVDIGAREFGT